MSQTFILLLALLPFVCTDDPVCSSNCLTCNASGVCQTCSQFFYLNSNTCQSCPNNCLSCTSSNNCQSCLLAYYSHGAACLPCPNGCMQCTDSSTCTQCVSFFYLSQQKCTECTYPCLNCTDSVTCLGCAPGYYVNNFACLTCDPACEICDNINGCKYCKAGHYLVKDNLCASCDTCQKKGVCSTTRMCPASNPVETSPKISPMNGFSIALYVITPLAVGLFLLGCCLYIFMKNQAKTVSRK